MQRDSIKKFRQEVTPWLLEGSTLMLELDREGSKQLPQFRLTPCSRTLLAFISYLFTAHKFNFPSPCFTSPAHSHREPPLPSHEGRRPSADPAFPPAPPLLPAAPTLLKTTPNISQVYLLLFSSAIAGPFFRSLGKPN